MKAYRIRIEPITPWATPWYADTLFAALAWQVAQRTGEGSVRRLVDRFAEGDPPFILSDAFPEGWLPCPLSMSLQPLTESNVKSKLPAWVSEDQFRGFITRPAPMLPQSWESPVAFSRTLHASIDRHFGTTGGAGNLFEVDSWHLRAGSPSSGRHLVVYVRTAEWLDRVVDLLQSLSSEGFGKKRSAGMGAFRLVGFPEACDWMDHCDGADGYVSLSHFIPSADDPTDGRWGLLTKYPKFAPGAPVKSPFKGRVLMLRPGSVFRASAPIRPFYGRIVKGIWPDFPAAIQYGLAFSVPVRWPSPGLNSNAS